MTAKARTRKHRFKTIVGAVRRIRELEKLLARINELASVLQGHSRIVAALVEGYARWEPFAGDASRGEVCVGGLRYATALDRYGVPEMNASISQALYDAKYKRRTPE